MFHNIVYERIIVCYCRKMKSLSSWELVEAGGIEPPSRGKAHKSIYARMLLFDFALWDSNNQDSLRLSQISSRSHPSGLRD